MSRKEVFPVEGFFNFIPGSLPAPILAGMVIAIFQHWLNRR